MGSPATSTRPTFATSAPTTEISVARLDRLIQVMHEQRAEGLQLAVGKPASLVANGGVRPVTKDALTDAQILGLLREIAGETQVGGPAPVGGSYRAPTGEVHIELASGHEGARCVGRPPSAGPGTGSASAGASAAVPRGPDLAEARAAME